MANPPEGIAIRCFKLSDDGHIQQSRQQRNNPQQLEQLTRSFLNTLNQHDQKHRLLTSLHPDVAFSRDLAARENEPVAAYALAMLMGLQGNQATRDALLGAYWAFQYQQGNLETVEASRSALDALTADWKGKFQAFFESMRLENTQVTSETDERRKKFDGLVDSIGQLHTKQQEDFGQLIEKATNELEDIKRTYDQRLALQQSVTYWREKQSSHQKRLLPTAFATGICALMTIAAGILAGIFMFGGETIKTVPIWHFGVPLVIFSFGIWLTRLNAKIFISNLHLHSDAEERVTMIQTYLALLREGSGPEDNQRELILQTLFRPTTSGIVKDDGPGSAFDVLSLLKASR